MTPNLQVVARSIQPSSVQVPTTHTPGHIDCPACDQFRLGIIAAEELGKLTFHAAAPLWLAEHKADISTRTHRDYLYYIRCLGRFFGELPLEKIHFGHLKAYQLERLQKACPESINHEINTLSQVLDRAGLWSELAKFYKPLKLSKSEVGCAMEPADEERLFRVAASNYRWKVAYWCSIITATTTAGPGEIAHLHLNDVELGERPGAPCGTLHIRDGLKNGYRERIVVLNEASRWAASQILKRYFKQCARLKIESHSEHYVLMGRGRRTQFDPWKPMGSWKKAWRALRKEAGLPNLRMYDLRHHAITKLMEDSSISERTIEEMAGHALSSRMKQKYSHIRIKPKAEAAQKLELKLPPRSVGADGQPRIAASTPGKRSLQSA